MKRTLSVILVLIALLAFTLPVFAADTNTSGETKVLEGCVSVPNMEVTTWYIRNNNGVWEQRLWSVTFNYWKTEWQRIPGQM